MLNSHTVLDINTYIILSYNIPGASFYSDEVKSGKFVAVDESTAPVYRSNNDLKEKKLKPIAKPANFIPKQSGPPKLKPLGGVSVLPNLSQYTRPTKPVILYEYEASADCRRVREACSILDINVDFKPCPGATAGWSDVQSTITLGGKRTVPFLIGSSTMI